MTNSSKYLHRFFLISTFKILTYKFNQQLKNISSMIILHECSLFCIEIYQRTIHFHNEIIHVQIRNKLDGLV